MGSPITRLGEETVLASVLGAEAQRARLLGAFLRGRPFPLAAVRKSTAPALLARVGQQLILDNAAARARFAYHRFIAR